MANDGDEEKELPFDRHDKAAEPLARRHDFAAGMPAVPPHRIERSLPQFALLPLKLGRPRAHLDFGGEHLNWDHGGDWFGLDAAFAP